MVHKCDLCGSEIGVTFLDKLEGTVVRVGSGDSLKKFFVCSTCQKLHKEGLKEEISKTL
jgi:hypothetical protein